jgi:radical SAM protein with 4Fe4S-binding SPASM domain
MGDHSLRSPVVISPRELLARAQYLSKSDQKRLTEVLAECQSFSTPETRIITRDSAVARLAESNSTAQYSRCLSVPYFWFYINARGQMVACSNHMLDERFVLGDLNTRTLSDIWYSHSDNKREWLKGVMRGFDVSQCRKACRMDRVNEWLWKIQHPGSHANFI